jgi:hypothetical protein
MYIHIDGPCYVALTINTNLIRINAQSNCEMIVEKRDHCEGTPLGTDDCCFNGVLLSTWLGSRCQQHADKQFESVRWAAEQRLLERQLRQPCTETIPSTTFLQDDEGIGAIVVHVVPTLLAFLFHHGVEFVAAFDFPQT